MLFKAKMLFSAAHGRIKPFCVLISRFPHVTYYYQADTWRRQAYVFAV